jgi:hypothetical protein
VDYAVDGVVALVSKVWHREVVYDVLAIANAVKPMHVNLAIF